MSIDNLKYPVNDFGFHILCGVLGRINNVEIGPGYVVLSEERYSWLLESRKLLEKDSKIMTNNREERFILIENETIEKIDIYHDNHPLHHMIFEEEVEWDECMKNYEKSQS